MRNLGDEACPGDVECRCEAREHAIQFTDPVVLGNLHFEVAQFAESFCVNGLAESARFVPRAHSLCHRGKGKYFFDPEFACVLDQSSIKGIFAGRWPGFADENDKVIDRFSKVLRKSILISGAEKRPRSARNVLKNG